MVIRHQMHRAIGMGALKDRHADRQIIKAKGMDVKNFQKIPALQRVVRELLKW